MEPPNKNAKPAIPQVISQATSNGGGLMEDEAPLVFVDPPRLKVGVLEPAVTTAPPLPVAVTTPVSPNLISVAVCWTVGPTIVFASGTLEPISSIWVSVALKAVSAIATWLFSRS